MASTFGWLDADDEQRRRMLELVDQFREQGTVDELGIGSIRDALADALFPGTTVLHTRLRYALFVPWLLERASSKSAEPANARALRTLEIKLIDSLLAGGEMEGVIGNRARARLQRLPSLSYWSAVKRWGIVRGGVSIDGYFRQTAQRKRVERTAAIAEEFGSIDSLNAELIDAELPPSPKDLLESATFSLTSDEEDYLSQRIAASTRGSLFAWLVSHPPPSRTDYVWEIDNLHDAPPREREIVEHARMFHTMIHGAHLTYSLLLARATDNSDATLAAEARLRAWQSELRESGVLAAWDSEAWWRTIAELGARVSHGTAGFVDGWVEIARASTDIVASHEAAELVRRREASIKRARARLSNRDALDRWTGTPGAGRLEFRWSVAQRHLWDLYDARSGA